MVQVVPISSERQGKIITVLPRYQQYQRRLLRRDKSCPPVGIMSNLNLKLIKQIKNRNEMEIVWADGPSRLGG